MVSFSAACGTGETATPRTVYIPPMVDSGSAGGPTEPEPPPPPPEQPEPPQEPEEPESELETCAIQTDLAKLKPLDMFIMLDRSGSMNELGKWAAVTSAISTFAANPASAGIGVGMGYFPETYSNLCVPCDLGCAVCINDCCALPTGEFCFDDGDCDKGGACYGFMCHAGGGNASCDAGDYALADVAMSELPGAAAKLSASMALITPSGGTPTGPALQGALNHAAKLASSSDRDVVVVLASDGEPTECEPQGIGEVAAIAGQALAATPAVRTFVIGVGTSLANLNAVAAMGGTQQAYLVDANATVTQALVAALNAIRKVAVACNYEIPSIDGKIAYDLVNVTFASGGKSPKPLGYVASAAQCQNGGWYYDDPQAPKAIVMCPATCGELQAANDTKVEIVYGCETIVK
jgi:Mg-chelatase subunit ChlD